MRLARLPILLCLLLAPAAQATLPLPVYPECGEEDRPDLCPADLNEEWSLLSYVPSNARDSVRLEERDLGSGVSADRAWRQSTGRYDVLLAVADSGIEWENRHLINKIFLNVGELPLPQDAAGEVSDTYDLNGDGLVNVQDYAADPRVDVNAGRDAADGLLDPSDLIYTFSDGVDDDGDGYTDNIAGWDFFGRDNDPYNDYATGYGTHGSGVMEEAAAEGGTDGDHTIGVCPNCAILPVRIGDTFVTDGSRAGEGIAFAVDSGAVVVNLATGALSNPDMAQDAVRYALDSGVSLVGAAGDENAYHHNFPAMLDGVLYVHSIRHNTASDDGAVYSYMNTWNCNNYGPRITLVASSSACATGACAVTTGVVGLLHSAARDMGLNLSAGEVSQLLIQTADDVWLSEDERAQSKAYPSEEGWDPFFGYGRINAARAVDWVKRSYIPPVPELRSPRWFDTLQPDTGDGTLEIEASIAAQRSSGYSWELSYGTGDDPRSWTRLASGDGTTPTEGVIATLDLGALGPEVWGPVSQPDPEEGILERMDRVFKPAVTLRLMMEDAEGRRGEDRKTFFVQRDHDLLPGFPMKLGVSGESSPVLADLDGDGVLEVLLGLSDGRVLALRGTGEAMPGWPVRTDPLLDGHDDTPGVHAGALPGYTNDGILATVAAGDLEGDGQLEVVAATGAGAVYAWHADGSLVDGFPAWSLGREPEEFDRDHTYDQGFAGAPALEDLDGDGALEIIVAGLDSRLYVFDRDANDWGPYPIEVCHPDNCGVRGGRIVTSPTIGDVDGDGDLEIGLGSNESVDGGLSAVSYLFDANTGEAVPGWPVETPGALGEVELLPLIGEGHPASMAFADLDGDGDLEIANPIMLGLGDILGHDGQRALDLGFAASSFGAGTDAQKVTGLLQVISNPAFGDMDRDGVPDLVLGGSSTDFLLSVPVSQWVDFQQAAAAWSGATGEMLPGWPRQVEDLQFLMAPAIADLNGDGLAEAIYGSAGYLLHAWDAEGRVPSGWPHFTGQWLLGSPAVGDIDGDGYLDVVIPSREGWLWAWRTDGPADGAVSWQSMHHDSRNTGNFEVPLPTQAGPVFPVYAGGGCCSEGGPGGPRAWLVGPLLLGAGLRRRRRS